MKLEIWVWNIAISQFHFLHFGINFWDRNSVNISKNANNDFFKNDLINKLNVY